ncbi:hypothetical protein J437_LFUL011152, partial [Ladona fulva]
MWGGHSREYALASRTSRTARETRFKVPLAVPKGKPDWLNDEQLERGRQFAVRYLFGLLYSEMLSLAMLFSFRGSMEPLLFTGNSDSTKKAFRRYLSTTVRVISWYDSDAWTEGTEAHANITIVRQLHESVVKRMKECDQKELQRRLFRKDLNCPYLSHLRKDFGKSEGSLVVKDK